MRKALEERRDFRRADIGRPVRLQLGEARLVALDQLVAVPLRQVIVGVDVEPPEELRLPRRQRVRAHGLDIDNRHQTEQLETLLRADERRELFHDLGILGIAPEGGERHPEVMPDQEQDDLATFARDCSRSSTCSAIRTLSSAWSSSRHFPTS